MKENYSAFRKKKKNEAFMKSLFKSGHPKQMQCNQKKYFQNMIKPMVEQCTILYSLTFILEKTTKNPDLLFQKAMEKSKLICLILGYSI